LKVDVVIKEIISDSVHFCTSRTKSTRKLC
jgi:hypothetical protein